jgi:ABC-type transporter Mla subunit MlaD
MSKAMRSLMDAPERSVGRELYEFDEHAWIAEQVTALRTGRLDTLDRDCLAEYLTEMTARDRRELESRLVALLQHLLKVQMQPAKISRSWAVTIVTQQDEIRSLLQSTPSLAQHVASRFADAYQTAIRRAAAESGIAAARFPADNPWTLEQALHFNPPAPTRTVAKRR